MHPILRIPARTFVWAIAALAVFTCVLLFPGAAHAATASQQVYPAHTAIVGAGAQVTTSQVQSDAAPSSVTTEAG